MDLTALQESIFEEVKGRLDSKYTDDKLGVCLDFFKSGNALDCDRKIQSLGFEKAVQMIQDDSLYWAGFFT